MFQDIGVMCRSCQKRNTGTSSECTHCGSGLFPIDDATDSQIELWIAEQLTLRKSIGLVVDDEVADGLRERVQPDGTPQTPYGTVSLVDEDGGESIASRDRVVDFEGVMSEATRSDELLAAILTVLRGLALFLILSFTSSFFAVVGLVVGTERGENGGLFILIAGLAGLGAVGALISAWSVSGSPFKSLR